MQELSLKSGGGRNFGRGRNVISVEYGISIINIFINASQSTALYLPHLLMEL